jgi:ribulose-phosphate 3-epimerase
MDGRRFVPNITFGPVVVRACRRATELPLDAHLMVADAEPYLDAFADAGATSISVHVEAVRHLQRAVAHLRERGVSPGVALNPSTPIAALDEILPELDTCRDVQNPGFVPEAPAGTLDKLRRLRKIGERGLGVSPGRRGILGTSRGGEAGADIVVVGCRGSRKAT